MKRVRRIRQQLQWQVGRLWDFQYAQLAHTYKLPAGYKRIYHYHIRKTGGTSLNLMFLGLGGESGIVVKRRMVRSGWSRTISQNRAYAAWNQDLIEQGYYFYGYSHIPAHELHLPKDTFTLTCLRDPAARVISHYKMLFDHRERNRAHPMMDKEGEWLGNSFGDFLERVPKEHLLRQLYMFSSSFSVAEAAERILNCSCFLFVEEFARGVQGLSETLQLDLHPLHAKKSVIEPPITESELEYLRDKLQLEYTLYELLKATQA
jgi:Sulfotransferase family